MKKPNWRRRAAFLATSLALLTASPAAYAGAAPATGDGRTEQLMAEVDEDIGDATRFRSEMGLAADPSVLADITRSRQRSEEFGLALTQAEEAPLNERAKLPAELDRLAGYQRKHAS